MEKRLEVKLDLDEFEMRALYLQMVFTWNESKSLSSSEGKKKKSVNKMVDQRDMDIKNLFSIGKYTFYTSWMEEGSVYFLISVRMSCQVSA